MKKRIIGVFFVIGILCITVFTNIMTRAGPALQPLTSPNPQIIYMIQQVNESLLYYYNTHLTAFGPRVTGTENCTKASQYIYDEFHAMGLAVEFHNWEFYGLTFNGYSSRNIVATLEGSDNSSNAIFIICAHYDTEKKGISPGANDDGSGVAAILTIAKILSQYSFNYTIRFIAFSGEEVGLLGSNFFARDASLRGDNIVAILNLDEIGYATTKEGGRTIDFCCSERSKWIGNFASEVSKLYISYTNMTITKLPNIRTGDHHSFVCYGFDGVHIVQDDYDEYYANYTMHTKNDTSSRINWTYLTKSTKILLSIIGEMASTHIDFQVIITKPYQGYFYFFDNPIFSLDFWKNNYHGLRGTTFIIGAAKLTFDIVPDIDDDTWIVYCIDGNFVDWGVITVPHYEWEINNAYYYPLIGRHIVQVYIYTLSGKVATDEINIFSFVLPKYFT